MSDLRLILASASPYRASILKNLGLAFDQIPADIDETPAKKEAPRELALRLGLEKARKVSNGLSNDTLLDDTRGATSWIVIGSDQVCHHKGKSYGKPGDRSSAISTLSLFSGDWVTYSSSLALIRSDGKTISLVEDYECQFRDLSLPEIEAYVDLDNPWDCAGSIRIEKAAPLLMQATRGRDINTLIGLPVMALNESLQVLGHNILNFK